MIEFNTLVLSGGGLKGITILGSLQYLFDHKIIERDKLKKYIGTSVGAIINVLLIIGYEPKEIIAYIIKTRYLQKIKVAALSGVSGKGFLEFDSIKNMIVDLFEKKKKTIPTIKEFCQEFNISFVAVTFNYTDRKEFTISSKNSPDLNLLDALQMTSNVPFVFKPFQYKNDIFFDGFLSNNYPINKLDDTHDFALGIHCDSKKKSKKKETLSTWNFLWDVILIPLTELQKMKVEPYYDKLTNINLDTSKIYDLDYNLITVTKILDCYSDGFLQTKSFQKEL